MEREKNKSKTNNEIVNILKEEIRLKQEELNKIVLEGQDKDKVLRFSQELDILISTYLSNKLKTG